MASWFCKMPRRYFSDRLDGQPIPWWSRALVRMHLRICPQCIRYNRSLEATRSALGALRDRD
jgi:predicted anti-sigma-YlaC factor YlaD